MDVINLAHPTRDILFVISKQMKLNCMSIKHLNNFSCVGNKQEWAKYRTFRHTAVNDKVYSMIVRNINKIECDYQDRTETRIEQSDRHDRRHRNE